MDVKNDIQNICILARKIGAVLMTIGMLANAAGCGNALEQRIELAEKLLEEKYGIPFEVYAQQTHSFAESDIYKIKAYAEEDSELRFEGEVYTDSNYIEDEYIGRLIGQSVEQKMSENINNYLKRYEIIVLPSDKYAESNDINITIEEYLREKPEVHFLVYLIVDVEEVVDMSAQSQYDALQKLFADMPKLNGKLKVFYATEEELQHVKEYKDRMTKIDAEYSDIMEEVHSIDIFFTNSNLNISYEEFKKEFSK